MTQKHRGKCLLRNCSCKIQKIHEELGGKPETQEFEVREILGARFESEKVSSGKSVLDPDSGVL